MCAVRVSVRVFRHRVRPVVLIWRQQLPHGSFLKFDPPNITEGRRHFDELLGNRKTALVVASDFSDEMEVFQATPTSRAMSSERPETRSSRGFPIVIQERVTQQRMMNRFSPEVAGEERVRAIHCDQFQS